MGTRAAASGAVELVRRPARRGEHVHVFPLSNWTELDVGAYIEREKLDVPFIYYAHERPVSERDGCCWPTSPR